jgi:hypothetical protein
MSVRSQPIASPAIGTWTCLAPTCAGVDGMSSARDTPAVGVLSELERQKAGMTERPEAARWAGGTRLDVGLATVSDATK